MGKVIVLINSTLDGFVDAQNVTVDAELFAFTRALMADAAIGAFGRNTFELFQERWPPRLHAPDTSDWMRKMAQALHEIPKVVFSSTLKTTTWNNSTIARKLDRRYIDAFKQTSGGTLLTFGSLSLIEALTEMNVVDDYYFNIQPVLPGTGNARFFSTAKLNIPVSLTYVDATTLSSGAHIIHYRNAGVA